MRQSAFWRRERPAGWSPWQGDAYVDYDITEALAMQKGLDEQTYTVMRALTGVQ